MEPEVPQDWSLEPLGELGSFHKSRGGPKRDDEASGVPVVRYGELYTHHHEVIRGFHTFVSPERAEDYTPLEKGDLLFAGAGETAEEIGKSAVFLGPEPARGSGDMIIFRPNGRLDSLFLGYASNGRAANTHKRSVGQGSSIMHIYAGDLETLELPVPPLSEQKKIAAVLSSVDDAIAATRKVIEQTKRVKKGLLQDLMTRGIGHTRFKKTEIGKIPEEWEVRRLRDLVQPERPISYGVLKPGPHVPGGVPVVRVGDYEDGTLDPQTIRRSAPEIVEEFPRSILRSGDLLISIRGTSGRVTKVPPGLDGANISRDSARISVREPSLADFLLHYLRTDRAQVQVHGYVRGLAVKGINLRDLRPLPVPVPPVDERNRIVSILQGTGDVVRVNRRHLSELQTLKRGLMQDLLTGRVRVPVD